MKVGKPEWSIALTLNNEWLPQLHTQILSNDTEKVGIAHNSGITKANSSSTRENDDMGVVG